MFDLPKTSEIRKPLHKKLIYEKYAAELSGNKKDKFDADISRMIITNEISEASVNIKATEEISAIFVLQVELKRKEYDDKNIIMISKLFGQKLLIVLHYENAYQLAIYKTRLLKADWKNEGEMDEIKGWVNQYIVFDNTESYDETYVLVTTALYLQSLEGQNVLNWNIPNDKKYRMKLSNVEKYDIQNFK